MIVLTDARTKGACLVEEQAILYAVPGISAKDFRGSTLVFGNELMLAVEETPEQIVERIAENYAAMGEYEYETEEDEQ